MPSSVHILKTFSVPFLCHIVCKSVRAGVVTLPVLMAQPLHAQQTLLGVHGVSYNHGGNFNNRNPGLYGVWNRWTVGLYENSINRTTMYAGYAVSWDLPANPLIDSVSLMGSIATGYDTPDFPYKYSPLGALSFKHQFTTDQGIRLSYLPVYGHSPATYVLHLSYEMRIK
jgi:hypothetical protein